MKSIFKSYILLFILLSFIILWSSCGSDNDPIIPNEEELITTLILSLQDQNGVTTNISFQDLDGDGGEPPIITAPALKANTSYIGTVQFLNELAVPVDNITEEVVEEAIDHQIFYVVSGANITINYTDDDGQGNPLGITTSFITGPPDSGVLTIILRHQPDKNAAGVVQGDPTNAGGETDIEVSFNIIIE